MKIGIIGPGALGCLFASKLFLSSDTRNEILLIDHNPDRATMLNDQGICYTLDSVQQRIPIPISSNPSETGSLDILFCCVKSHDLAQSLSFAAPLLSPSTLLVFLQNGISHLIYDLQKSISAIPVFATSSEGATLVAPGHINHAGTGTTHFGFLSPQLPPANKRLAELTDTLNRAGINSSVSEDIRTRIWAKLFINVGINALTAIYNRTNGQLLTSCAVRSKIKLLVKEAEQIAIASGISIKEDPVKATFNVCKRTAKNVSSMLQDVRNCRPTEIHAINEAICTLGRKFGIPTPANDDVSSQVRSIEQEYSLQKHNKK